MEVKNFIYFLAFLLIDMHFFLLIYVMYLYRNCYDFEFQYEIFKENNKEKLSFIQRIELYYFSSIILAGNWILEKLKKLYDAFF